jgi:hypothetical protein
MVIDILLVL